MGFRFRLETSLRLAKQEMDIVQGLLAQELRILRTLTEQREKQESVLIRALDGQTRACLYEPKDLPHWQKYTEEQNNKLRDCINQVEEQETVVAEHRARLVECKIKCEKFKKLKEKKRRLYEIETLRKEQMIIDEIAQNKRVGL